MSAISLRRYRRSHLPKVIEDLLCCGWTIETVPEDGKIPLNGLKIALKAKTNDSRLRILAYKVSKSGRSRPHERRVEITTTYQSGLERLPSFRDVVLGVDLESGKYVGVDARRLEIGGPTHNASSFFDPEGLSVSSGNLLINPRSTAHPIFPDGIELHAFFDRSRLSEYLFNVHAIHTGLYAFGGTFSGRSAEKSVALPAKIGSDKATGDTFILSSIMANREPEISRKSILAFEIQDHALLAKQGITPEQLKHIMTLCDEIGALGEQAVLKAERTRLRKLGLKEQANKVEHVSLRSVSEGYDIVSFEDDGVTLRYLEVKASIGKSTIIDVSRGEWQAAERLGSSYYFVRVTHAQNGPTLYYIRDPVQLTQKGLIFRTTSGWKIDLRKVMLLT